MNTYLCAYFGQYVRVQANTEKEALKIAREDYQNFGNGRVLDWKDSEHMAHKWEVLKTN